jgi:hypothetical protein
MAKITAAAIIAVSFVLSSAAGAFDLQGHRGARGLAPENTLAAFSMALSIGVTTLELDLAIPATGLSSSATTTVSTPTTRALRTTSFSTPRGPRSVRSHWRSSNAMTSGA